MIIRRLLALLLVVLAAARPLHADAVRWRADLLFLEGMDTTFGAAAQAFKRIVEQRTHGQMVVTLLPDGRWDGRTLEDLEMVTAVIAGRPQMAMVTAAPLSNLAPQLEIVNCPFLFKSYAHVDRVLDGAIGERLLAAPSPRGLRGLAFMDGGFRLFATSRPVATLADFRGLRVRTLQNRTYVNLVLAFRGVPVPAPINRIYDMVRRGFVDAADRSYPTYWSLKLYDVLKFITETNHAYAPKVFVVSEKFYASLPPEVRAIVKQAAMEARLTQRRLFRDDIAKVKKLAAARGVRIVTLSPQARREFEQASVPVQQQVERMVGRDLVQAVRAQGGAGP